MKSPLQRLRRLFDYALFYIVDWAAFFTPRSQHKVKQLLLVRVDAIGDFILWLDSAKAIRAIYPYHQITLCVNAVLLDFAKLLPHWDHLLAVDLKLIGSSPRYRYAMLTQIRRLGADIAIQPTFSRVFLEGDALVKASGAKERIGSVGNGTNMPPVLRRIADRWYTQLVPAQTAPLMELERNAEFLQGLGRLQGSNGQVLAVQLVALPKLGEVPLQVVGKAPFFVIFPGASWVGRQWPAANFASLISAIHHQTNWCPVLCGSAGDNALCQEIIRQSGVTTAINLAGATSLPELAEVLRSARALVSNETSAVHMAAAVATPTVCILGGGHFGRFMPYPINVKGIKPLAAVHPMPCFHCNWHCTQAHVAGEAVPCISQVTVAQVKALFDEAIDIKTTTPAAKPQAAHPARSPA